MQLETILTVGILRIFFPLQRLLPAVLSHNWTESEAVSRIFAADLWSQARPSYLGGAVACSCGNTSWHMCHWVVWWLAASMANGFSNHHHSLLLYVENNYWPALNWQQLLTSIKTNHSPFNFLVLPIMSHNSFVDHDHTDHHRKSFLPVTHCCGSFLGFTDQPIVDHQSSFTMIDHHQSLLTMVISSFIYFCPSSIIISHC